MSILRTLCPGAIRTMVIVAACALCLSSSACVSVQKSGSDANAETSEPTPAQASSVNFASNPGHAEIWIEDEFVGTTPLNYRLTPGLHHIEIRTRGFQVWTRELRVKEGLPTSVYADLVPLDLNR